MPLLAEVNFNPQMFMDLLWNQAAIWGPKLLLAALTLFIGWRVARILGVLLERALDRRHIDPTLKPFLTSLLTMLVKAGVVVTAISTAGIQATSFAALFASAGLAIGLALSGTLQNFAGGVILLIVRPFKVGDVIEVQSFIGTVSKIEIFQTILITGDNKMIHIPNGKLQNDSIVNYSALPDRRVDKARDIIAGVIKGIPEISDTPEYKIVVGQLADSSVNLTVRVWAKTPDYWKVHFTMNEQVKKALDAAGISIPFPQRDIHVLREKL